MENVIEGKKTITDLTDFYLETGEHLQLGENRTLRLIQRSPQIEFAQYRDNDIYKKVR